MKKAIIGVILAVLLMPNIVKADSLTLPVDQKTLNSRNLEEDVEYLIDFYNDNYSETFNYYLIIKYALYNDLGLYMFNTVNTKNCNTNSMSICPQNFIRYDISIGSRNLTVDNTKEIINQMIVTSFLSWTSEVDFSDFHFILASNYNFKLSDFNLPYNYNEFIVEDFYSDDIVITNNIPTVYELDKYNSWSDYENNHLENYTEVNLDDYEYVILTLKNYNQTQAFDTNLQVKGQIGITPVYNYGQTSKDAITGVKVQDRCNVAFENYTSYPLYVINTDLQNNVVYIVKECSSNSSFKFSTDIFNITYVTNENKDDPVVTINGNQYHVIPFDDLPSTANKNEEENYIPGESGSMNDTGGLDGALKGIQQKMGEIWDTITYFTGFINQMFSILPTELKTVLMSAFVIAIMLGLIKIFIN